MTIKDVAARTGLSHQAIYKRLKANGLSVSDLKDKASGQLTEEGERILAEMFSIKAEEPTVDDERGTNEREQAEEPTAESGSEELRNEVARLTTEVEKLRNQVATLEEKNTALTEERDFLRLSLERSQQLQAITASKIPNPRPLLTTGAEEGNSHKGLFGGIRAWWARRREPQRESAGAHEHDE